MPPLPECDMTVLRRMIKEMREFILGALSRSLLQRTSHPCDSLQVPNESDPEQLWTCSRTCVPLSVCVATTGLTPQLQPVNNSSRCFGARGTMSFKCSFRATGAWQRRRTYQPSKVDP